MQAELDSASAWLIPSLWLMRNWVISALLAASVMLGPCGCKKAAPTSLPPPVVQVMDVTTVNASFRAEIIAQLDSLRKVEIRTHVEPFGDQMRFAKGTNVNASGERATPPEFDFVKRLGPAPKPVYPPNNGFLGGSHPATLLPGTRVDRFGSDFGRFLSPEGTPFVQRSLPRSSASDPYSVFEVVKPLEVRAGKVAPWFDMPGGGTQYQLSKPVNELINQGYLRPVLRVNL